jgi:hypothetical protein
VSQRRPWGGVALAVGMVGLGLLLAGVETWLIWGYWLWPPSLSDRLSQPTVRGFAALSIDGDAIRVEPEMTERMLELAREHCSADAASCGMARLAIAAMDRAPHGQVPLVDQSVIDPAWEMIRASNEYQEHWASLAAMGKPPAQGAIIVTRGAAGDAEIVLAIQTSEIRNDKYQFGEWMLSASNATTEVAATNGYRFDQAGIEGLTWSVLATINSLVLATAWSIWRIARSTRSRPAVSGRT